MENISRIKVDDNVTLITMHNIPLDMEFIAKIFEKLKCASDDEKEILELALKIGIQCLSEDEVNLNDY